MDSEQELLEAVREIRRNQERQLAGMEQSLEMQRQQFEMARTQFERADRLNDRAEKIQESGARMMATARIALVVLLPIIFFLLIYLTWLIMR